MARRYTTIALFLSLAALFGCADDAESQPRPSHAAQSSGGGWTIDPDLTVNGFLDCLEARGLSIVSAHRGGPATGVPENSLASFERTLDSAPALMEFDVATSKDGVVFLLHDDTLERTTTGGGVAAEMTWSEISSVRLTDPDGRTTDAAPPTFADALAALKDRTFAQVDFKRSTRFEDVIDEIRRQDAADRVVLIAYTLAQAKRLHRLAPDMMISLSMETPDRLEAARAQGLPDDRLLGFTGTRSANADLNETLDAADVETIFGTLGGRNSIDRAIAASGEESRYAEIAALGVDIIATDRPIAAHRALLAADRGAEEGMCGVKRQ
ncbi:MAG: glycerophosphodiester phosphodiesterase family protein [Pseudomonadota bacterium]